MASSGTDREAPQPPVKKAKKSKTSGSRQGRVTLSQEEHDLAHQVSCALVSDKTKTVSKGTGQKLTQLEYEFVWQKGLRTIFRSIFINYATDDNKHVAAYQKAEGPIGKLFNSFYCYYYQVVRARLSRVAGLFDPLTARMSVQGVLTADHAMGS